ncbi:hypothetical protein ABEB36_013622 [Hypothenemus hampei]|uniref:DDE-1 domain-containing protein n=1 Tax=Hypothenemus hampei TaxID=57062 RepID=A0ABD1E548_HYPHA
MPGQIVTMFLQPNVTPLIQPMDQNTIQRTKLYFRNSLLINDMINLAIAWNRISNTTIAKCWKLILSDSVEDEEDNLTFSTLTFGYWRE